MGTKHSPGPWKAVHVIGAGWSVRRGQPREGCKECDPVCSMAWWQFDIPGVMDDAISGANAHLIEAAPDLLNACEALPLDQFEGEDIDAADFKDNSTAFMRAMELARAAIAKAKGESP